MFKVVPVKGKPNCFTVYRDCDNGKAWHGSDMLDRYYERRPNREYAKA